MYDRVLASSQIVKSGFLQKDVYSIAIYFVSYMGAKGTKQLML